jgi:M6 family metalloprotease-like protein
VSALLLAARPPVPAQPPLPGDLTLPAGAPRVLAEFDAWTRAYVELGAKPVRGAAPERGAALAKERREILRAVMKSNPQAALAAAVPDRMRQALPPWITEHMETPISGIGDLTVLCALPHPHQPVNGNEPRLARINGNVFEAFVYGRLHSAGSQFGVPLRGVTLDGVAALEDTLAEMPAAEMDRRLSISQRSSKEPARSILVIRVDFADLPGDPRGGLYTASYVQNLADTQIARFFHDSSYSRVSLRFTVTPKVYRLPKMASFYAVNGLSVDLHQDAQTQALADFNLADYDVIAVLFSPLGERSISGSNLNWVGLGEIGGRWIWLNGDCALRVFAHELGHIFGAYHANLWTVTDGNPVSGNGRSADYGDPFDCMGLNWLNHPGADFNPWFKYLFQWIDADQIQTITRSGVYRLYRYDSPEAAGTLALRIPRDEGRDYWVGLRRSFTNNPSLQHGAYVIWGNSQNRGSDLLDTATPGTNSLDAALTVGTTLADPLAQISITPVADGGGAPREYMDLRVVLGPLPPVVLAQPEDQTLAPGQSAVFTVEADGTPPLLLQWERLPAGSRDWELLVDGKDYHGSRTATLVVKRTTEKMNHDQFRCRIGNATEAGLPTRAAWLEIVPFGVTLFAGMPRASGSADRVGRLARFNLPRGIAVGANGTIFVADMGNSTIRRITPEGSVSTLAGQAGVAGSNDGEGQRARFSGAAGIVADAGGNLYVADYRNSTLRRVTPEGAVSTLAGRAGKLGAKDGRGASARFKFPTGLALDSTGNLFVADRGNSTIRKVSPDGRVTTWAGIAGEPGSVDGVGNEARFSAPTGLALDPRDNLYVSDQHNSTIRKITPAGRVSTWAGTAGVTGLEDGHGHQALFDSPAGLAVDPNGSLYVADQGNCAIRQILPSGEVKTVYQNAEEDGRADREIATTSWDDPFAVAVSGEGSLYVAGSQNHSILLVRPAPVLPPRLSIGFVSNEVSVSWSPALPGYTLESRALGPGSAWSPVADGIQMGDTTYLFPDAPAGSTRLFRLRR